MARPKNKNLPAELLAAAHELLVEKKGPHFSMREVSARVGYTLTAVYRCFDNRAALLRGLMLKLHDEFQTYCAPSLSDGAYFALRTVTRNFMEWAVAHPYEYLFMFSEYREDSLLTTKEDIRTARAGLYGIGLLLNAAKSAGEIDIDDPEVVALQLLCYLHGLASLSLSGRFEGNPAEDPLVFAANHGEQMLIRLLGVRPEIQEQ